MIRHLNCASFHPALVGSMVAHVLLVERPDGLLLVDSGFGLDDIAHSHRLGRAFKAVMRPALREDETAVRQVEALGFTASDVTDIVVTHLDLDHAGGLGDFPRARVHVYEAELEAAKNPRGMEHGRYVKAQWQDADFVTHGTGGDDWFGFESVTALGDDVVLVPLVGHSRGHAMVAVRDRAGGAAGGPGGPDGWQVHAGDAYFHSGDMTDPPTTPRTLRVVQKILAQDDETRVANAARLRELVQAGHAGVRVFSAHDPGEYAAFAG